MTTREQYLDGKGLALADVRRLHLLPERVSDWGPAHRIKLGGLSKSRVFGAFHAAHSFCWICGTVPGFDWDTLMEAHHWTSPNRSDEICCLAMACRRCHRERVSQEWLPRWAWAVWKHNHEHCDWVRATLVRGSWLPTPEPPPKQMDFWLPVGAERKLA